MNRYLAPAPVQWDLGQQSAVARNRFGPIIDVNEVDNGDGTRSIAVYLDKAAAAGTVTGWRNDVAAAVYAPDPSRANQQTVAVALVQALTELQAVLDTATIPAGTLTTAQLSGFIRTAQSQLKTVALHLKRAIRYETGDFTGTD